MTSREFAIVGFVVLLVLIAVGLHFLLAWLDGQEFDR